MDYPLTQPGLDLYLGKFTDGVPGVRPASVIPSITQNAIVDELKAVIVACGLVPSEGVLTQLRDGLNATYTKLAQFGSLQSPNGYQKLPSGLIIQWGTISISTPAPNTLLPTAITFPIAFPTACLTVGSTLSNTPASYANVSSEGPTTNGFSLVFVSGTTSGSTMQLRWFATGK
ncbi:gp53-like domain-containing protein [Collimonas pratensis]|uniref:gp53-like domain-containing protein n=1 Tax=Collimonas pratensis TaxID=279113 RepID=UPI000A55F7D1